MFRTPVVKPVTATGVALSMLEPFPRAPDFPQHVTLPLAVTAQAW
jgi:hypothetical protein